MAMTATQQLEAYRFFAVAFDAAPGVTYMSQLAEAYAAGMTTEQIVEVYTAKAEFLAIYPNFLTNNQFATRLVNNVVDSSATDAAKAAAVADIEAALAAGWSQGKVIYTIFSNLAAKDPADATWGATATLMANQVAVAKYYTEEQLGNATSVTALQSVISAVTASTDVSSNTALAAAITAGVDPVVTVGQTFTLTTNVDAVSGGAGDDVISGLIGASGTYSVGDAINGNSGSDTLNLIDGGSATAAPLVSLSNVETVNVRMLSAGTTIINANDWTGVTTLTNASSFVGATLNVTGVATTTTIKIYGDNDANIAFNNTTTATDAVNVSLVSVGLDATAGTMASASAAATANIDLDLNNSGLLAAVALDIAGTKNLVNLEAGSNVRTVTVTGSGNAFISTDDLLTSFNATAAAGNLDVTLSGASDVIVKGGAGNDILRLGTTLSNNDSFDGGDGTDTIVATVAGFNRNLNTTNVENATLTFTEAAGGTVNASGSTLTSYTFVLGTAGNAVSVSEIANGATLTLNDDDIGDATLDYASGASTTILNIGSVSGTVGVGTLAITDVAAVTINAVGVSGTVGGSIGTATFDADVKSIAILTSGGEADLTIGTTNADGQLGGATSLTVTSNGSASITFNNVDIAGSQLASVNVYANNTDAADITLGDVSGALLTSINLNAASGADVVVGTVDIGAGGSATAQDQSITIVQGQTANATVGAITVSGQGTLTLNVTQNGTAVADIGTITMVKTGTADAAAKNFTLAATTVAGSGEVAINGIDMGTGAGQNAGTGAQVTFGTITVSQDGGFSAGAISGSGVNIDVSSIEVVVGSSASANFAGFVGFDAGALGARSVTVANAGSANFGAASASAIGTTTIVANTGVGVDFGNMVATTGGSQTGGAVGAIEISGVDGADVTFGTIAASAVGAIGVSGALDVTIGTITAARIGEVNNQNQGVSGTFTIDLSGVAAAAEVKLGIATNTVLSGEGNDVITLTAGRTAAAGNDNIQYSTASQGTDNIIGFIAGNAASGGDQIELAVSAMFKAASYTGGLRDLDGAAIATGTVAVDLSANVTAATATVLAADNILVLGTAMGTTAAMMTFMQTGIILGTAAMAGSGALVVAWTDSTDTYVSIVNFDVASAQAGGTTGSLASATLSTVTLATLSGVTPGQLVAANFDFISLD